MACSQSLVKGEDVVCTSCWTEMSRTNFHRNKGNELMSRFYGKIEIEHALSYFYFSKSGKIQKLLHQLKYKSRPDVGEFIGLQYGNEIRSILKDIDFIIPVPLYKSKLRKRGYNQSAAFGKGLEKALDAPQKIDVLIRTEMTETQTQKSRVERWKNVEKVFKVIKPDLIKGSHILLIDDVVTTGSTLEACAKELLKSARKISIATIAIA